jgi:hypothetical protein
LLTTVLTLLALALAAAQATLPTYFPDDPIAVDPERQPATA